MKNLIFKSSFHEKLKMLLIAVGLIVAGINTAWARWTVAASSTEIINGSSTWSPSTTTNDLTNVTGNYWALEVSNKTLTSGTKQFKICKDQGWSEAYPSQNYNFTTPAGSGYTILYTFDSSNKTIHAYAFKTWTIAGTEAALGSDWDVADTNNDMTKSNAYTYTLTKTNVALTGSTTYECKAAKDHAWGEAYPGSNATFSVATTGRYDITFTLDLSTQSVTVSTTESTYSITLNKNGGSANGSATATYNSTSLSSVSAPTRSNYHVAGYYTNSACTTKVATPEGALQANTTYTDANSKWTSASDQTLYAKWEGDSWSITWKDQGNKTYSGSNSASLPASYTYGTGIASLTDGVKSGYRFDGWFDNSSCTGSAVTSISSSATGNKIFYAKWTENPGGTVTLTAGTGGQVSKNGSSWGASTSYTGIKSATPLNIYAQANTGYAFSSWSKTSGSGTITSTSSASTTFTPVANADAALTASFTETMRTITITGGTAASTTAGVVTTGSATAAEPAAGKKFTGWTLGDGVTLSGGAVTDRTINFTASQNSSVTANYADRASVKMYFAKPPVWGASTLYAYAWKSSDANVKNADYPGVALSTTEVINCVTYYTYQYYTEGDGIGGSATGNSAWDRVIFGCGSDDKKTGDLTPSNGHYYYWNSATTGSASAVTDIWYIKGTMNNWGETNPIVLDCANNKGTVNINLTTGTTYEFKVYDVINTYMWSNSTACGQGAGITATMANAETLYNNDENVMKITPNVTGSYTFEVSNTNTTSPKIKVTFPTTYTVTYSVSPSGAAGAITTSPSVSSGGLVLSGTSVTFTHAAANSGYTWYRWENGSGSSLGTGSTYTTTISAATTVVARYTENQYDATVSAGAGGSVSPNGTVAIKQVTGTSLTATANPGYYFTGWTISGGGITPISSSSATQTFKATGTGGTIQANFALCWTVTGSDELNGWTVPGTNVIDHISTSAGVTSGYVDITLLANKDYEMKMYDKGAGSTKYVGYASNMAAGITYTNSGTKYTLNTYPGYNFKFKSAAAGSYRFTRDLTNNKLSITYPTSRKITIGTKTTSAGSASADPGDGGVVTAVDNSDNTITDGDYVADNASVTFTAAANYGYSRRGWYGTAECTGEPLSTAPSYTISNITTDKTVYVLFEEALYNVTVYLDGVTATVKEAGVASHPEIVAVVPTGKVFDRWVTTGSAVVGDRFAATTTITSVGDNQSSVTATFKDLPKIYIDATSATGWTSNDMYVVFYKNGGYFDTNNGTGLSSSYVITPTPCKMTKIDGERIWYYEYDPTTAPFAGNTITCVAFVDHTFAANYGNFTSCTVVYRNDFNSCMNMFVVTDNTGIIKNTTAYYRNTNVIDGHGAKGYWRNYGEVNSGFYLNNLDGDSFEFTDEDGDGTYTTYVNLDANTDYLFYIGGCNGWNWSNDQSTKPFNYSNPTHETYPYDDDVPGKDGLKSKLTTTEAGYYTFSMTPKRSRALDVTITFPVAANDYRAVYNNAASSPTITRPSNIIKNDQNSGTISLWLNQGTNYITFQKCSIASGGAVSWPACGSRQTVTGVAKAGVYTMTLTRNGSTYSVSTPVEYTGDFYVRTDCADGGWRDYQKNVMGENTINYKASDTKTFNYYYCKWVNDPGVNMKAVIANEINPAISDVVDLDDVLEDDEHNPTDVLPYAANVRFSYNTATNELKRAYLNGANDWHANFLTLEGNNKTWKLDAPTINLGTATFVDQNNWIYMLDIKAQGGAYGRLTGTYNDVVQYFVGAPGATIDASTGGLLLGGSSTDKHTIRLTYDFKTNLLLSAWLIDDDNVTTSETIQTDIMFVRKHQEGAKNLTFATGKNITEVRRAYGVMKFNKWILNNQEETGSHNPTSLSQYERDLFFISFPFDVELSDVFGFGTYGVHWIIQYYDGYNRAQKGYWKDSPPNWKFVTSKNFTLKANTGYILALDLDNLKLASDVWNNNVEDVYIYFPSSSTSNIGTISSRNIDVDIDQDGYECTINRGTAEGNRTVKDSYWHIIGVPGYADYDDPLTDGSSTINWTSSSMPYLYEWNKSDNSLSVTTSATFSFKSMHAYMVQYSGTKIHWTGVNAGPASIIARAKASYKDHYDFRLELLQGEEKIDQTYVSLRDDENVTNNFDFNYDLTKEMNANKASLYTMVEGYIQTAGSCLPLETENVTIVPVGIQTIADGEYTFSMPDGTDGVGVTLIDNVRGMRTNLALSDYMVELEAGTYDDRFVLEISPIEQIVTNVEKATDEGVQVTGVCKKLVDGVLYIVKDGKVFDARGARIQ